MKPVIPRLNISNIERDIPNVDARELFKPETLIDPQIDPPTSKHFFAPLWFWKTLDMKNKEKPLNAKIIVVLQADADENHAFSSVATLIEFFILADKGFYIVFQRLDRGGPSFKKKLNEIHGRLLIENRIQRSCCLIIRGHGATEHIKFGFENTLDNCLHVSHISRNIFSMFTRRASIVLDACNAYGLGQKISSKNKIKKVFASYNQITPSNMQIQCNARFRVEMFTSPKHLYTNLPPLPTKDTSIDEKKITYLKTMAEQSYADLQFTLAEYYEGKLGSPADQEKAIFWYIQSGINGDTNALVNLCHLYAKIENGLKKELFFQFLSAQDGNIYSQFLMGFTYENGLRIQQSLPQALSWYHQAAKNYSLPAIAALNRLYTEINLKIV